MSAWDMGPGAQLVVLTEIFSLFARIGWFLAETCQTVFPLQRENPYVPVGIEATRSSPALSPRSRSALSLFQSLLCNCQRAGKTGVRCSCRRSHSKIAKLAGGNTLTPVDLNHTSCP